MSGEGSSHALAAVNPAYGVVNFIVLSFPPGWTLKPWPLPPDVDEVVARGAVRWVASGSTAGLAVSTVSGKALEVKVKARKGPRDPGEGAHGRLVINGHEAYYWLGRERVGLLRRRTLDVLAVRFYCQETDRFIEIKIRGPDSRHILEELIPYLGGSQCH